MVTFAKRTAAGIAFKQLELNLWGDLKSAREQPEVANFQQLWQELDSAITPIKKNQRLQVAAEAISQIVKVYEPIPLTWETRCRIFFCREQFRGKK